MIRRQEVAEVEYFKCDKKRHRYRKYLLRKMDKEKQVEEVAACVAMPQKAQQKEEE